MRIYENVIVLGDFDLEPGDIAFASLVQDHSLYNVSKHPTCFKSAKGRCIDLMFRNWRHSFMHSKSFETGFSDHHHMIYTIPKTTYIKLPPKKFIHRHYKNWSQKLFGDELRLKLILCCQVQRWGNSWGPFRLLGTEEYINSICLTQ